MRTVLYYPYINLPNNEWLLKALLYWDKISSIVPDEYALDPSDELKLLTEHGIYTPTSPSRLFWDGSLERVRRDFENDVLKSIGQCLSLSKSANGSKRTQSIRTKKLPWAELGTEIHYNKLTGDLYEFMKENRLIKTRGNGKWLLMEQKTADIYISVLADYLAKTADEPTVLGTDKDMYLFSAFGNKHADDSRLCYSICLDTVLPTPVPNTSIKKIIKFKEKRQDELLRFRKTLDGFEKNISECKSLSEINIAVTRFSENMRAGLTEQAQMLKDARIEFTLGSVKALCEALFQDDITKLLTKTTPSPIAKAALALNGTLTIGKQYAKYRKSIHEKINESGFAYVYGAQKKRILNKL